MGQPHDGGAAFPRTQSDGGGMALRDWFAGQVVEGLMAGWPSALGELPDYEAVAEYGYALADAMLKAREGGSGGTA